MLIATLKNAQIGLCSIMDTVTPNIKTKTANMINIINKIVITPMNVVT